MQTPLDSVISMGTAQTMDSLAQIHPVTSAYRDGSSCFEIELLGVHT